MTFWTFNFDGIDGSASSFEGCTLIKWNGRLYELAFAPIDLKQTVLQARK